MTVRFRESYAVKLDGGSWPRERHFGEWALPTPSCLMNLSRAAICKEGKRTI